MAEKTTKTSAFLNRIVFVVCLHPFWILTLGYDIVTRPILNWSSLNWERALQAAATSMGGFSPSRKESISDLPKIILFTSDIWWRVLFKFRAWNVFSAQPALMPSLGMILDVMPTLPRRKRGRGGTIRRWRVRDLSLIRLDAIQACDRRTDGQTDTTMARQRWVNGDISSHWK